MVSGFAGLVVLLYDVLRSDAIDIRLGGPASSPAEVNEVHARLIEASIGPQRPDDVAALVCRSRAAWTRSVSSRRISVLPEVEG